MIGVMKLGQKRKLVCLENITEYATENITEICNSV